MSARERSRYITVAAVFLLAFFFLGSLIVRSARVMAQSFTFRPSAATANTYDGGVVATQRLTFAFDPNVNTAATTYTNADFSGDGVTPDVTFEYSGNWSIFQQTTTFIRAVGLYIVRSGDSNSLNQWRIQYTLFGPMAADVNWVTLEDGSVTANPGRGEITTTIPDATDLEADLAVRTMSRQENAIDAILNIYDIRVEADWDQFTGGIYPLQIDTLNLPDGVKDVAYTTSTIDATGGNPYMPGNEYDWSLVSGTVPPGLIWTPALPNQAASIQLSSNPIPTTAGAYTFTVRVSDESTPTQTDQVQYTVTIAGLGIDPPGPALAGWDPMVVDSSGGQTFLPEGGTAPYDWCLVSGSIPPGLSWSPSLPNCASSVATAASLYLSGTPTDSGTYSITIRLADAGGETPVEGYYQAEVSSSYVTIIERLLRPMIKGIAYGTGALQMTPQQLLAINAIYSNYSTDVTWSSTGLPAGLSLLGKTFNANTDTSSVNIEGTIGVGTSSGTYNFTATIDDNLTKSDSQGFDLEVLERRTLLRKAPPSAVALPGDHKLDFVVSAEGGAPSMENDTALDGSSIPYYTYYWEVTPVDGSPALETSSGTEVGLAPNPPYEPGPFLIQLLFEEDETLGTPVTGTYDVTFWARDYLRRQNPAVSAYRFVPVTTRIKIISPAGRTLEKDASRPTLLRQEQFR